MRQKRKMCRIHTRKIDRAVAHNQMKKAGCVQVNKHKDGMPSFFATHWRDKERVY